MVRVIYIPLFHPYSSHHTVAVSVILTTWRTRLRRQMNERDVVRFFCYVQSFEGGLDHTLSQATRGIHTDCLLNYETVKYFGGEEHEGQRYSEAIQEYQALEYKVICTMNCPLLLKFIFDPLHAVSLNLLNLVQNFIIVSFDHTLDFGLLAL